MVAPAESRRIITKRVCRYIPVLVASAIAGSFLIAVTLFMIFDRLPDWRSDEYFRALCEGKNADKIVSMAISGHGKQVVFKDRESIAFLARGFARLKPGISKKQWSSMSYDCFVTSADGRCSRLDITPYADLSGMEVTYVWAAFPWGDDRDYHVDFSEESPIAVKRAFEELIENDKVK